MYQRINGSAWRNIWLVGDLHGCFARLMAALRERRFDPYQDLLLGGRSDRSWATKRAMPGFTALSLGLRGAWKP